MAKKYGTLSTSNAAITEMVANTLRTTLRIQNLDASISIFANFDTAAVANQTFAIRPASDLELTADLYPEIRGALNMIAASGTPAYVVIDNT